MTSDDLKHALAAVAAGDRPDADPLADLARARGAARARARRRIRAGLAGVATAAVLAVGVGVVLDGDPARERPVATRVHLVDERLDATPYTFDLTPAGWSVQAQQPSVVTIAPDDGSTSRDPDDFRGKLVIMFDANPPDGRAVVVAGRRFWVHQDGTSTTVATRSRAEEPAGVVRIQYPADTGWDVDAMVAFLGSVHVGPGARHGVG